MIPVSERFKATGEFARRVDADREVGVTTAEGGKRVLWTITSGGRTQQLCLLPDTYQKLFELMSADILNNEDTMIRFGDRE